MRSSALAALFLALTACSTELPPLGQIVLHVDTDAPLPAAPGAPPADPPALFDRLRVEIFAPGESAPCEGCTRDFAVTADDFTGLRVSMGIVPRAGATGYRARVRLFRSGATLSGEPRSASTLETVAALPPIAAEGIVDATIVLHTDDVARPVGDLDQPVSVTMGTPAESLAGTWPGARRVDCAGQAQDGEVCIPGGAYWMGDPRIDTADVPEYEGTLERLAVLSPFFLDAHEVTVLEMRTSGLAIHLHGNVSSDDPHEYGGDIASCTFTSKQSVNEQRPVNCISWKQARKYCQALGRDLPSEAQYEYAAGALRSLPTVWGEDLPACADAVFDRELGGMCSKPFPQPDVIGSGARDRLSLPGGEVVDLMGNVAEWAVDQWNHDTEPCWGTGLFIDPVCQTPTTQDMNPARSYRGGAWDGYGAQLRSALRARVAGEMYAVAAEVGFRCARADAP